MWPPSSALYHLGIALEWHVDEVAAGHGLEHLAREMRGSARA